MSEEQDLSEVAAQGVQEVKADEAKVLTTAEQDAAAAHALLAEGAAHVQEVLLSSPAAHLSLRAWWGRVKLHLEEYETKIRTEL